MYEFEYGSFKFSQGGLDEKIYYDRYSTPEHNSSLINEGNIVICKLDKNTDKCVVGEVIKKSKDSLTVNTRSITGDGLLEEVKEFPLDMVTRPLDINPSDFWERWAKAGASVEKGKKKEEIENEFRWLFDGFRYSPGGRIQLMAGQEFVKGDKANLTAFNCFVIEDTDFPREDWGKVATNKETAKNCLQAVVDSAINEAQIMARGGGVGINVSAIPPKIKGLNMETTKKVVLYLPKNHPDTDILNDMLKLGKFKNVSVIDSLPFDSKNPRKYSYYKVEDSREGLLNGLKHLVEVAYTSNQYTLFDFSDIREKDAIVKGVNGRSSGSPSWMLAYDIIAELLSKDSYDAVDVSELFSYMVMLIHQGGSRRGALMLMLMVDHPNIEKFITRKQTFGHLTGANISVGITDDFMDSIKKGKKKESDIWNLIIESAWASAEPGVLFIERANKDSNSWYYAPLIATNPCGEQYLPAWGVCNLGHLVLSRFYDKETNDVNWSDLERAIKLGVRFQDNMIDYTQYFDDRNKEQQLNERRVGMGTMGLATLLIKMGIRYGSDESLVFMDKLFKFIAVEAYKTSIDLAIEKDYFPDCVPAQMAQSGFMQRLLPLLPKAYQTKFFKTGIRNVTILTQAPTGSTGTAIDNCLMQYGDGTSTGIEPYFAFKYYRASRNGFAEQEVELVKEWQRNNPNKELPSFFVTAQDLHPKDHARVQATIQMWVDSSISKTANCPNDYTVEDTRELYELAYDLGCKGMTIYRDGSRQAQVLATDKEKAKLESDIEQEQLQKLKEEEENDVPEDVIKDTAELITPKEPTIQKRPKRLYGFTEKINFNYGDNLGKAYVTISMNNGEVWEVFISTKHKEVSSEAKAIGLLTTKLLRLGGTDDNLQQAIDTLTYDQVMGSLAFRVANILKEIQKERLIIGVLNTTETVVKKNKTIKLARCSSCGANTFDKANCICYTCGASKCN
jgi:ribonucleoside-diphosphate reductase alpha chain